MRVFSTFILLISFTFNACSHVLTKYQNETVPAFFARVNKLTENKTVSLKTTSEKIYVGNELNANPDSTYFLDLYSNTGVTIATDQIISISFNDDQRAAWEGFLYGAIIGGVVGLLPNFLLSKGTSHPGGDPLLIIYGAAAGAVIGVIYGSYHNNETTIEIKNRL